MAGVTSAIEQLEGAKVDFAVQQYSDVFKSRMVGRLVGPSAWSASALAAEVGRSWCPRVPRTL